MVDTRSSDSIFSMQSILCGIVCLCFVVNWWSKPSSELCFYMTCQFLKCRYNKLAFHHLTGWKKTQMQASITRTGRCRYVINECTYLTGNGMKLSVLTIHSLFECIAIVFSRVWKPLEVVVLWRLIDRTLISNLWSWVFLLCLICAC